MNALFSSEGSILAVMFIMVGIGLYSQQYKIPKLLGPALTVIIMGIILSNLNIVPGDSPIYSYIGLYAIPVSMTLMLMNVDLKAMLKLSREPITAVILAVFSVSLMALIFGLVFATKINEGWKIAGMFVGTYTGGSANLTAIATGLEASRDTIAAANAADYVVGIPVLILFFAAPAIIKNSKTFKKIWPYHFSDEELTEGNEDILMASKEWSIRDIAVMLAIGFLVAEVATRLSGLFPAQIQSAARIILITTIGITIAQLRFIKNLKGSLDLGLYFSLLFLGTVGFSVNLKHFFGSAFYITLFCFCVIMGCLILHLALCRLFKLKYEYVVLSIVAAVADGTTASLVAASANWKSIVSIAIVMGALCSCLGNYLGVSVAYLIKGIVGI
ncbi:DUF819 family protein [Romboutsia weinsteinii]|uniref:DUF819 family protein n=1 Tax=Romboutsia weinsteinii TaxID=2020949 RepID=A0A371J5D3_9FIRM|nr:DUF819 family protein [Romboutsia weinsteinii]RDY27887.1 DUF819 family protein [Romboutsia weinsteinii]